MRIRNGDLERSGKVSCGIQSPGGLEISETTASAQISTLERSETQDVDLANKVRENHYLVHVDHGLTMMEPWWNHGQHPWSTPWFLFVRVCKDPLICEGNCKYLLETV